MDDTNDEYTMHMPSTTQQTVISSLQIPPSILSLIGSSLIIYNIRKCNKRTPHRRIMFALSVCNIISTIGLILDPFLVPTDALPDPWVFAAGNNASCVLLGAISQFSIISQPMYLGFLSLYFLLTVKFGIKQRDFEVKYERRMHGFILVLAISTALGGIFLGFFRPNIVSPGCWIHPPIFKGCEDGCKERLFAIVFGAVPSVMSLLAIVISNGMLYVHVRRTVVEGQKKTISQEMELDQFHLDQEAAAAAQAVVGDNSSNTAESETINRRESFVDESRKYASVSDGDLSVFSDSKGSVLGSTDKQWKRVWQVGRQAFFYVGAFLITFSWSFAIHYLNSQETEHEKEFVNGLLPLVVLQAIFLPALGFLNAIIFILPKYKSARKKYDYEPWWWVLEQVLNGDVEKVERFSSISNISVISGKSGQQQKGGGSSSSWKKQSTKRLDHDDTSVHHHHQVPRAISMCGEQHDGDLATSNELIDEGPIDKQLEPSVESS